MRKESGRSGVFITFEGIEGCGKTTQIARLAERLRQGDREIVSTREPGGTALGRELRAILLAAREPPTVSPIAELLLYAADRAQHLEEIVLPALDRGAIVLCDRYLDATLAYQGYGRQLGCSTILSIHSEPPLDCRPDRTVLLDLAPRVGLTRARSRDSASGVQELEGRFEAESLSFHERVRDGYLLLAEQVGRIRVVDAAGTVEQVGERVWGSLRDLLS
jgi:dTMP kinase